MEAAAVGDRELTLADRWLGAIAMCAHSWNGWLEALTELGIRAVAVIDMTAQQ